MGWAPEMIAQVWEKAKKVYGENPNRFRKDECGAWIAGAHYGNRGSEFGWVIERRDPNGGESLDNLCPCSGRTTWTGTRASSCLSWSRSGRTTSREV